jgi:anti-sigma regulatory factor (Ser/Thr protein kinase)
MPRPAPRALALRTTAVTYPGTADQIRVVRADLRALLDDCPMADDVLVCASELATNAVLHSHSRLAGGTFTVCGKVSPGDYFWLEVEDEGGPWTPAVADPERGHGLDIMRTLADDWVSKAITTAGPSGPASTGPARDGHFDSERAAMMCQHEAHGADQAITSALTLWANGPLMVG